MSYRDRKVLHYKKEYPVSCVRFFLIFLVRTCLDNSHIEDTSSVEQIPVIRNRRLINALFQGLIYLPPRFHDTVSTVDASRLKLIFIL